MIGAESVAHYSSTPTLQSASRFLQIADKRFCFVHRDIWIGYQRCQLVDDVARGKAFIAPVPRHTDLVDDFSVDIEGTHPLGDQRFGANLRARTRYLAPVEIVDAFFPRQFRTDLDEQLWLEFGEPRQPAAHPACQVMFGQPIRGDHIRELWIAWLRQLVGGVL